MISADAAGHVDVGQLGTGRFARAGGGFFADTQPDDEQLVLVQHRRERTAELAAGGRRLVRVADPQAQHETALMCLGQLRRGFAQVICQEDVVVDG
ncbi:hypothetical protein [Lentzea xinjiangensis]|uniref:hypothetical protein n=1 Tax=Lentzea xinjiangensis TaxID=402600 RepID=UPI0015A70E41|nr:hypothetical protein [Lentzea xinjiangensis]